MIKSSSCSNHKSTQRPRTYYHRHHRHYHHSKADLPHLRLLVLIVILLSLLFSNATTATIEALSIQQPQPPPPQQQQLGSKSRIMSDILGLPLDTLAAHATSYASANGIQVEKRRVAVVASEERNVDDDDNKPSSAPSSSSYYECAPMSLLPNAYPKEAYYQAQTVAPIFNELVDRVSRDAEFLQSTLGGGVSAMDPYTAKIVQLYEQVYVHDTNPSSPAKMADRLGIHRSDYMLHSSHVGVEPYQLKQVELNTIAASFAGLSCKIFNLHRYLTSRFDPELRSFLHTNQAMVTNPNNSPLGVPENDALEKIPLAMKIAYDRYIERFNKKDSGDSSSSSSSTSTVPSKNVVILFVVQEGETNTVDQRLLEFALWETYGIPVVRMSLTRLNSEIAINNTDDDDDDDGALKLSSTGQEVAVVYFRAGYAPTDYPDGDDGIEWMARLKLEKSRATKCPSLGYHLAGTKKVQQELARPGVLEQFFPHPEESDKVDAMRACFAGLYSMGDDAGVEDIKAAQHVLDGGEGLYVLKPQREGGGYNFYGPSLATKLRDNTSYDSDGKLLLGDTLAEYILMQRLFPPQQRAILLRGGKVEGTGDTISELGCYGCLVVDSTGIIHHNEYSGFLLRTKFSNVDEGGVASGFATLSSPYLC
jgi:glutathione synthetase